MARADAVHHYEAATRLVRGTRLGRYELLLPIAAGGMGQVWAARLVGSHGFSKLVAIKTILPMLVSDSEVEKMFYDEARVAALVHHPNVCQTLELAEDNKTLYMVMEWVDGASFRELVRTPTGGTDPVDPAIGARIMADVCAGLHAAHDLVDDDGKHLEVVHRDVSPQNVLLSVDGAVKVTDFGLVRALGRLHITRASRPKGKVGFMAPEQLSGGEIDRRADIFSAGCVLYESTTGRPPFPGDGEPQIIARMLMGEYELPSVHVPGYPAELEAIIVRALEQEPSKRFDSADAMHAALEKYLEKHPMSAKRLGAFVTERCKDIIAARREAIRGAAQKSDNNVEASDPGRTPVPTAPPAPAPADDPSEHSASRSTAAGVSTSAKPEPIPSPTRRLIAAGIAFGAIAAVGIVAYRMGNAAGNSLADGQEIVPVVASSPVTAATTSLPLANSTSPSGSASAAPQTSADPQLPTVSSATSVPVPSFPTPSATPKGSASAAPSASVAPVPSTPTTAPGIPTLPNPYPNE